MIMTTVQRFYVGLLFFFFVCFLLPISARAASLKFDTGTVTVSPNNTFTINAVVDAGSDQITSTDMWIVYDPAFLQAQSASPSSFFPAVTNNISSGRIYIAGLITSPGTYETGSGPVATITFKALQNGTTTISYDCRTDVSNSSKVIKNAVDPINVIVCSQNGTSIVTIGTGGSLTPTAQPTSVYAAQVQPTALPRTGIMDALPKVSMIGGVLVMMGIVLRLFLL